MTLRGSGVGLGVVLDQAGSWVLGVIFGADHHGIHSFCIFLMKISLLRVEIVKLKEEVEPWESACLLTFCEISIFYF